MTQCAVLKAPRRLEFQEVVLPDDELPARSIRAETEYTAVSIGTELAAYLGDPPLRPGPTYPRLVGYCNVARVVEAGNSVTDIREGDRVLTHQSHRGAFVCPANTVLATVPAGVESPAACMTHFAYLGLRAIRRAGMEPEEVVLVQGLGVIGLATAGVAARAGALVVALGNDEGRVKKAIELGASAGFESDDHDGVARFCKTAGKTGPDILITTVNSWPAWNTVLEISTYGSRIVVAGFPGRTAGPPPFNPFMAEHFYGKNLSIYALGPEPDFRVTDTPITKPMRRDMEQLLSWVGDGSLPLGVLITDSYRWQDLPAVYERAAARDKSLVGAVLDWRD